MDWKRSGRLQGPVVGTLMTNYGLERAFSEAGIEFIRAKVGDRHVHRALVERGGTLGGEASGHLLCLDRTSTGDGIVSALQVLHAVHRSGQTLAGLLEGVSLFPQTLLNVRLPVGADWRTNAKLADETASATRDLEGRGRVLIRPSGTEPVLRVMVEASDGAVARRWADRLASAALS
jgi:phosphoglucosamine mutase